VNSTPTGPISPASDSPAKPANPANSTTAAGPRIFGSELERRAAEVRREKAEQAKFIAQQKAEASLQLILAQPCPEHGAPPGKPCWRMPLDDLHHQGGQAGKAVCGRRIAQAKGVARIRREREARQQTKTRRSRR
jgi:hypothetical protein